MTWQNDEFELVTEIRDLLKQILATLDAIERGE